MTILEKILEQFLFFSDIVYKRNHWEAVGNLIDSWITEHQLVEKNSFLWRKLFFITTLFTLKNEKQFMKSWALHSSSGSER